eukprot:GHVQ01023163.1.p1 GENE.GHVQ01023163.1~~GHVQ01023163.1.p1  ORF type:complete len:445 (-),score=40.16 GHVQ01023163.1:1376-2710(-)
MNRPVPMDEHQVIDSISGYVLALTSAICYALFTVLLKKIGIDHGTEKLSLYNSQTTEPTEVASLGSMNASEDGTPDARRNNGSRLSNLLVPPSPSCGSAGHRRDGRSRDSPIADRWEEMELESEVGKDGERTPITPQLDEFSARSEHETGAEANPRPADKYLNPSYCNRDNLTPTSNMFERSWISERQEMLSADLADCGTSEEGGDEGAVEAASIENQNSFDMAAFFGCIGLIILVCSPIHLLLCHLLRLESLQLPPSLGILGLLLLNGLFGTALADFMWAKAVLLLNPLIATSAINLQIPVAMFVDGVWLQDHRFSWIYLSGSVLVTLGVLGLSLSHTCNASRRSTVPDAEEVPDVRVDGVHLVTAYRDAVSYEIEVESPNDILPIAPPIGPADTYEVGADICEHLNKESKRVEKSHKDKTKRSKKKKSKNRKREDYPATYGC